MNLGPEDRVALILGRAIMRTQILEAQLEALIAKENEEAEKKEEQGENV